MTKEQERKVKEIEKIMMELIGHPETKEIKEEEVNEIGYGIVSMVIEVGEIGDEGTMAEVLCRQRAHIFIGPKGGCYTYSKARSGKNKGKDVRYDDNALGVCWRCVLDK